MSAITTSLDAEEWLHIGMAAIGRNDNAAALSALKSSLAARPDSAQAAYLLGAVYAQIGMAGRAIDALGRALELDPSLHTARLHLGLLYASQNRMEQAQAAWAPLGELPQDEPLALFRKAFEHLLGERFDEARACLREGVSRSGGNQALARDMLQLLGRLDSLAGGVQDNAAQHVAMAAYAPAQA